MSRKKVTPANDQNDPQEGPPDVPETTEVDSGSAKVQLCEMHGVDASVVADYETQGLPPGTLLALIIRFGKAIIPLLPYILPFILSQNSETLHGLMQALETFVQALIAQRQVQADHA
jgi:hypothetical protein